MEFQLHQAKRSKAKIKLGLQGPSGSGKTYSALLLAKGLTGDWSKIAVIDTENHSADLYSHLGDYKVLSLGAPFSPERYNSAIQACENEGVEVITTIRTKQDYVMSEKNGKVVPEKVGLKGVTREGMDYELTIVFDINVSHMARVSKDRTGLFDKSPEFIPNEKTGQRILQWCNQSTSKEVVLSQINSCSTVQALSNLYHAYPELQEDLGEEFKRRKSEINSLTAKPATNGRANSNK